MPIAWLQYLTGGLNHVNDLDTLAKLVDALEPWRGQRVFVGGWAHRIHQFSPRANQLEYEPVFTRDTDLAFASDAVIEGDIKTALESHGFTGQLTGELRPPVAHYTLGNEQAGFYAEFLTLLSGSGRKAEVSRSTSDERDSGAANVRRAANAATLHIGIPRQASRRYCRQRLFTDTDHVPHPPHQP